MRIVFAGGGTAGHIEPALAVARQWSAEHPSDELLFLGTTSGLETHLVPQAGYQLCLIPRVRIPRSISPQIFRVPMTLVQSIRASKKALRGASVLVGFGGYVSAPAYIAAKLSGVPIVIHEANAKAGIANKVGSLFTPYLAVTQPISQGKFSRALITGLPLRADVVKALKSCDDRWDEARAQAKSSLGFNANSPLVLVVGGSQGSRALNDCILASRKALLDKGIQILHALGKANSLPDSLKGYVPTPYIEDMATAYLAADLIIARSGAVTCSEIGALGRYALFIPLPVGNGEQRFNTASLLAQGRAEMIDQREFTSSWLISNIERLLKTSSQKSGEGSRTDIDAALKITNLMELALSGGAL
jgi:UDP-N-acetylglucosamine--N-acetylmuramyl-(pentapeptide) pyrophosphoryl-undecaprenol N-acetylglucosamine transferase